MNQRNKSNILTTSPSFSFDQSEASFIPHSEIMEQGGLSKFHLIRTDEKSVAIHKEIGREIAESREQDEDEKRYAKFQKIFEKFKSEYEISDFLLQKKLGKGGFGRVILAQHTPSNTPVAIKTMRLEPVTTQETCKLKEKNPKNAKNKLKALKMKLKKEEFSIQAETVLAERRALKTFKGSQFPKYYGACWKAPGTVKFLMEPLTGGSLYDLWKSLKTLSEEQVRFYMASIVLGLEKMHARNVVHKDLKLENLVLGEDGYVRLIDFGLSQFMEDSETLLDENHSNGTHAYLSPELLDEQPYGPKVDIWALGIVMHELLVGSNPFRCNYGRNFYLNVTILRFDIPEHVSNKAKSFISSLLKWDPNDRPTATKCKKHRFFKGIDFEKIDSKEIVPPNFSG